MYAHCTVGLLETSIFVYENYNNIIITSRKVCLQNVDGFIRLHLMVLAYSTWLFEHFKFIRIQFGGKMTRLFISQWN